MLVIQGVLAFILVVLVLLQRSEGGALGIGGNSAGNFMTPQGAVGFLAKATIALGIVFMVVALLLSYVAKENNAGGGLFDDAIIEQQLSDPLPIENDPNEESVPLAQ